MKNNYNDYDFRIAETMVEVFFKKHGYLVQKYGIENNFNGLEFINTNCIENSDAKDIISQIMTMPDFVIAKLDNQNVKEIYLIDVKLRKFNNFDDFKHSIKNGELQEQAKKYQNLWKGQVHIFLILNINGNVNAYYDSVNQIVSHCFINKLSDTKHAKWIDKKLLEEFNDKIKNIV